MVIDVKVTIPEVNNSERIRGSFTVPRNTLCNNAPLDLDRVL